MSDFEYYEAAQLLSKWKQQIIDVRSKIKTPKQVTFLYGKSAKISWIYTDDGYFQTFPSVFTNKHTSIELNKNELEELKKKFPELEWNDFLDTNKNIATINQLHKVFDDEIKNQINEIIKIPQEFKKKGIRIWWQWNPETQNLEEAPFIKLNESKTPKYLTSKILTNLKNQFNVGSRDYFLRDGHINIKPNLEVTIKSNSPYYDDSPIEFIGNVYDPDNSGEELDTKIQWFDNGNLIDSGKKLSKKFSAGRHNITATITDNHGAISEWSSDTLIVHKKQGSLFKKHGKTILSIAIIIPIALLIFFWYYPPAELSVITDKKDYETGDSILVQGTIKQLPLNAPMILEIWNANEELIVSRNSLPINSEGTFSLLLNSENLDTTGIYTVKLHYDDSRIAETTFEFVSTSYLDVFVNKDNYIGGDTVEVTVDIQNLPLKDVPISIQIYNSKNNSVYFDKKLNIPSNGITSIKIPTHSWISSGVYSVLLSYDQTRTATDTFSFTSGITESITLETNQDKYRTGDKILLFGKISVKLENHDKVKIRILAPDNSLITKTDVLLSTNNSFKTTIPIDQNYWKLSGSYKIESSYGNSQFTETKIIEFNRFIFDVVYFDKMIYMPGEEAIITVEDYLADYDSGEQDLVHVVLKSSIDTINLELYEISPGVFSNSILLSKENTQKKHLGILPGDQIKVEYLNPTIFNTTKISYFR